MKNKKTLIFFLIVILAILVRWYPIQNGNFTLEYDNAKDSLIIQEMFQYQDPSLVGAITSIPGLFNGPLWYYLALIPNIVLDFHPLASVITVWLLVIVNLYLLKKYVNHFAAFLYAVSAGLIGAQQNSWIPYLTTLIAVPNLIVLNSLKENKTLDIKKAFLIGLFASLYFHSQAAFGIVFVLIIPVIFYLKKIKLTLKSILTGIGGFFASLSPLIVFELKNNFIQSKAIWEFVSNWGTRAGEIEPNQTGLLRIVEIGREMLTGAGNAILPTDLSLIGGLIALFLIYQFSKKNEFRKEREVILPILIGSFLLYLVLPAKAYYLVALMPVWIYGVALYINKFHKNTIRFIVPLFIIVALFRLNQGKIIYQNLAETSTSIYSTKRKAVETAYQLADGRDFRSYHFVAPVYDYTYQQIYLQMNYLGQYLPTEFSYAPGESTYNTYKHIDATEPKSNIVILIIENYIYPDVYQSWWERVGSNLEIEKEVEVSQAIKVIKAIDENY